MMETLCLRLNRQLSTALANPHSLKSLPENVALIEAILNFTSINLPTAHLQAYKLWPCSIPFPPIYGHPCFNPRPHITPMQRSQPHSQAKIGALESDFINQPHSFTTFAPPLPTSPQKRREPPRQSRHPKSVALDHILQE